MTIIFDCLLLFFIVYVVVIYICDYNNMLHHYRNIVIFFIIWNICITFDFRNNHTDEMEFMISCIIIMSIIIYHDYHIKTKKNIMKDYILV